MPSQQKIIRLAIPTPLRRSFDYLWQASEGQALPPIGGRVKVSFGRQQLIGYIIDFPEKSAVPIEKLKTIDQLLDEEPLLPEDLLKVIRWAAQYYQHPIGEVFSTCLPSLLNKGAKAELASEYYWQVTEQGKQAKVAKNAIKQQRILNYVKEQQGILQSALREQDFSAADLDKLVTKGWLTKITQAPRSIPVTELSQLSNPSSIELNKEQHLALARIYAEQEQFKGFLLDGVTGSGKTEVYLRAIEQQLMLGKQVLVLVPEIGLTPQTVKRFKQRFNCSISMLHSGLTDKQRLNRWLEAKQGLTSIVIGTRSALFTPFKNLSLIIIDEEHDLSYKQQEGFRYSAKDLALFRAQLLDIPIILGSATPSIESNHNVQLNKLERLTLKKRAGAAKPPHIKIFDVRQRPLFDGLSEPLLERMAEHLAAGNQCLIFLNRRGYAPNILCHDCGWLAECNRCDRNMTYHQQFKRLHCHHCDRQVFMPKKCPSCQSDKLVPIGLGTERLEESLINRFPDKTVVRVDRDTTRKKQSMNEFVNAIKNNEIDILVGTQMLAKGHHFPNLTLVGVVDIDGCLFSADFRATERTAQLLTQVAGRAGRGDEKGEVIIQTHHPDHPLLVNLFTQNYQSLSEQILQERKQTFMPPYTAMALLRADANQLEKPIQFLQDCANLLQQYPKLHCFGPYPAPMAKRAGKMRAQLMIQADSRKNIQQILHAAIAVLEQMPSAKKVRWTIDVDPQEVF